MDKYSCKCCDYSTNVKANFERHNETPKHILTKKTTTKYICENCNEVFNSATTKWRHKKMCTNDTNVINTNDVNLLDIDSNNELEKYGSTVMKLLGEVIKQKDEIIKQKDVQIFELQNLLKQQGDSIVVLISEKTIKNIKKVINKKSSSDDEVLKNIKKIPK